MKTRIKKVGNAYAVILPPKVAERFNPEEELELTVSHGQVVIHTPRKSARASWEAQFKEEMKGQWENPETIWELPNMWDEKEWEW